jgi:hypothetical protein
MVTTKTLGLLALLALAGCQTTGGSFCDIERPNRDPVEDMTPAEARTALTKNLKGAALCGWEP